jgi:hypothetical protein
MSDTPAGAERLAYATHNATAVRVLSAATLAAGIAAGVGASRAGLVPSPAAGALVAGVVTVSLLLLVTTVLRRVLSRPSVAPRARGGVLIAMLAHAALAGALTWWLVRLLRAV